MENSLKNEGKFSKKSGENYLTMTEKSWENSGKILENSRKMIE